jgi:hypothetical protein
MKIVTVDDINLITARLLNEITGVAFRQGGFSAAAGTGKNVDSHRTSEKGTVLQTVLYRCRTESVFT